MKWTPTAFVLASCAACFGEETLRYSINWPSGLSLGEAEMTARPKTAGKDAPSAVEYRFRLDASLPGFAVIDNYRSLATLDFCSLEFEKRFHHGGRKGAETITFPPGEDKAIRRTENGGKSEVAAPKCAKDALAYLYWLRAELQQGRLPSQQTILFGAAYQLSLKFAGTQNVVVNEKPYQSDHIEAYLKGPASETRFDLFLGRDPSRKLLMVRVPFAVGSFSMELLD